MRTVSWSAAAGREFDAWIDHLLSEAGDAVASRAQADVTLQVARLSERALIYRPSRLWPSLHEFGLRPWRKLVIYSVDHDRVEILGFYDQRQDLSAVDPLSK